MKILTHRHLGSRYDTCQTLAAIQRRKKDKPIEQPSKCKGCPASKVLLENPEDKRIIYIRMEGDAIKLASQIAKEQREKG